MFEAAELGRKVSKKDYALRVPALRTELLVAQRELAGAGFSVIVLLGGMDGAGRSETANLLHSWMDARFLTAHAFGPPSEDERDRPEFWRYWMSLPPAGRTGVYVSSWYTDPIIQRTFGEIDDDTLDASMQRIANFERMLADDGTLVIKLWLHIGKKRQAKRLDRLAEDPLTRWRVTSRQRELLRRYDDLRRAAERALRLTSTGETPWVVIEAEDIRYRNLAVAEAVLQELVLEPILGIGDPRQDPRIDFVGGSRGAAELERRCREDMAVAFAFAPASVDQIMAVADAEAVMPPKSTWFEPKLRSGLLVRSLTD